MINDVYQRIVKNLSAEQKQEIQKAGAEFEKLLDSYRVFFRLLNDNIKIHEKFMKEASEFISEQYNNPKIIEHNSERFEKLMGYLAEHQARLLGLLDPSKIIAEHTRVFIDLRTKVEESTSSMKR